MAIQEHVTVEPKREHNAQHVSFVLCSGFMVLILQQKIRMQYEGNYIKNNKCLSLAKICATYIVTLNFKTDILILSYGTHNALLTHLFT
jgi:hypothetical protein